MKLEQLNFFNKHEIARTVRNNWKKFKEQSIPGLSQQAQCALILAAINDLNKGPASPKVIFACIKAGLCTPRNALEILTPSFGVLCDFVYLADAELKEEIINQIIETYRKGVQEARISVSSFLTDPLLIELVNKDKGLEQKYRKKLVNELAASSDKFSRSTWPLVAKYCDGELKEKALSIVEKQSHTEQTPSSLDEYFNLLDSGIGQDDKYQKLSAIASNLNQEDIDIIFDEAFEDENAHTKADGYASIFPFVSPSQAEIIINHVTELKEYQIEQFILHIAPFLSDEQKHHACALIIDRIEKCDSIIGKAELVTAAAPCAVSEHFQYLVSKMKSLPSADDRYEFSRAFQKLSIYCLDDQKQELLYHAMKFAFEARRRLSATIDDLVWLLEPIIPEMNEENISSSLDYFAQIPEEGTTSTKYQILDFIAEKLNDKEQIRRAMHLAIDYDDEYSMRKLIPEIIYFLPKYKKELVENKIMFSNIDRNIEELQYIPPCNRGQFIEKLKETRLLKGEFGLPKRCLILASLTLPFEGEETYNGKDKFELISIELEDILQKMSDTSRGEAFAALSYLIPVLHKFEGERGVRNILETVCYLTETPITLDKVC